MANTICRFKWAGIDGTMISNNLPPGINFSTSEVVPKLLMDVTIDSTDPEVIEDLESAMEKMCWELSELNPITPL